MQSGAYKQEDDRGQHKEHTRGKERSVFEYFRNAPSFPNDLDAVDGTCRTPFGSCILPLKMTDGIKNKIFHNFFEKLLDKQ